MKFKAPCLTVLWFLLALSQQDTSISLKEYFNKSKYPLLQ